MSEEGIEERLLILLNDKGAVEDSWNLALEESVDHQVVVGVLKSLSADGYVDLSQLSIPLWRVTEEGLQTIDKGAPEMQLLKALPMGVAKTKEELELELRKEVVQFGMGPCMKNKWIKKDGAGLVRVVEAMPQDVTADQLRAIVSQQGAFTALPEKEAQVLKKRQLIAQVMRNSFRVSKGPNFSLQRKKKAADLTRELLESGEWQTTEFKPFNFNTLGAPVVGGYYHPLLKVRSEFRKILMSMGFEEMPTNRWVESSFWNFDALFQPQSHPARDAHDTFFIKDPASTLTVPEDYYERVKAQHEVGGFESIGYGYDFKREEAMKNLLRTHTTAISAQMLYRLAKEPGDFKPRKYFSIDRVFRNETMDATHLCEFHQVEGLVADRNLTLGDLIGVIRTFFEKIGITQLKFKPAYNPYTEPSMEVFGFHPDLNRWTEIGNSGIFRPEMLRPMGLPEDVRVIAWGLSLERPTMIKYRISNIRELFGHKASLDRTKVAPICRF